jgi:nucleoside diphosphate kinase
LPEVDSVALLVIKPDGVAQGITRLTSLLMRDHGYHMFGFRELALSPERQLLLGAGDQAIGQVDRELSGTLYSLGPVQAVLLERKDSRPEGALSAAAELAQCLTGDVLPHRAQPGTVRGYFKALNPVFNLVHATADTESLDREARALFDRPLAELLEPGGVGRDGLGLAERYLRPFKLWSTVTGVLSAWLGPEAVRPIDWPADVHGPSHPAVGAALMACTRAAQRADGEDGALLAGVLDGSTSYARFADRAAVVDPWHGYLTYTTLRCLRMCADNP